MSALRHSHLYYIYPARVMGPGGTMLTPHGQTGVPRRHTLNHKHEADPDRFHEHLLSGKTHTLAFPQYAPKWGPQ